MARMPASPRKAVSPRKPQLPRLYDAKTKVPVDGFNALVVRWLKDEVFIHEHKPAAAFSPVRTIYDQEISLLGGGRDAHRELLSRLTPLLLNVDLSTHLQSRLLGDLINETGFRTALSQGQAKNNGENFVNTIVYALAQLLSHQDDVLVQKGTPPGLQASLCLKRKVKLASGEQELRIPIECDFAIFRRSDPTDAVVVSAKTRLKEVFHIGTMWKLLFDMVSDDYCERKWQLTSGGSTANIEYCFATADMIPPKGTKTQGPDVERDKPRNLIAMDASFFDYVFVSKAKISHVSDTLDYAGSKEALFHELGCILDLVEQKFGITLGDSPAT